MIPLMKDKILIKPLKSGFKISETGNKAKFLLFLLNHKFRIPETFILPANLYDDYLQDKQEFRVNLRSELQRLPQKSYAVRSSAKSEDTDQYSCAGQFQTITNVEGAENLLTAVIDVWESAHMQRETDYHKKLPDRSQGCAVLIQEMINSILAGVSFSKNPITNQNEVVIEALEGPGENLVQKGLTPLRWKFLKNNLTEGDPDYYLMSVIRKVASDTIKLKRIFRKHVDIEWVYNGCDIYYLQFRPVTGTREMNVYSSKMAKEMLPGQIKPLVWSINIPLVNGTWIRLLSEITGKLNVSPSDLARSFYYRTYFNITELGKIFREFGLSTDSLEMLMMSTGNSRPSFKPGIRTIRHLFRMIKFIYHKLTFESTFIREYDRLQKVYKEIEARLTDEFSLENYPKLYDRLLEEGGSLTYLNIVIPILARIYNKRLKKRLEKRGMDYNQIDFNQDFPELKKYSPLYFINQIKEKIDLLPEHIRMKCDSFTSLKKIPEASPVVKDIEEFLQEFGHFSESGTDFSVPKWKENPEEIFKMIMKSDPLASMALFRDFSQQKRNRYSGFGGVYRKAGMYEVYREKISSLFIYGHGLFRTLFLNLGEEFKNYGIINTAEDIFFLDVNEINNIIEEIKKGKVKSYISLIKERKDEIEASRDYVLPSVIYGEHAPILETDKLRNLRGVGTSAGVYKGKTIVVRGTRDFENVVRGDVVLIPFSDVSWIPVLSIAGAIVSETGGLLSHCSIIAREMGIPALASVENACAIGTGMNVTVDGSNGILTVHDYE